MGRWNAPEHDSPDTRRRPPGRGATVSPGNPEPPLDGEIDPYLRWAISTDWRGFARAGHWLDPRGSSDQRVRIIACAKDDEALQKAFDDIDLLDIANAYKDAVPCPKSQRRALHFTATVRDKNLGTLKTKHSGIQWELATPVRDPSAPARASAHGYFGPTRDVKVFVPTSPFGEIKSGMVEQRSIDGPVVAVIDYGCPFLHDHFCYGSTTRVAALWDQGARSNPGDKNDQDSLDRGWAVPVDFGHGYELGAKAMNAMREQLCAANADFNEATAYAGIKYLTANDDPRRRVHFATHGAHVLDMAAGGLDPLTDQADHASNARLVFVQLPALTAADSAGGSLGAHLLDAVRYVLHVCAPEAKLVINISYGSFAGPHDGTSLIERALDELLDIRRDNFAIVLGAGNARGAACHVRRRVAFERSALLHLNMVAGDSTDTFVEVGYTPPPLGQHLEVRVRRANEKWGHWVGPKQSAKLLDLASDEVVGQVMHGAGKPASRFGQKPGRSRAMILLALRPSATPIDDDGPLVDAGLWEMEIQLVGATVHSKPVELQAWIERDDPADYSGRSQSSFLGLEPDDSHDCLSSIATGIHTVVVGGFRVSDDSVTAYSSRGPRRPDQLPLILAACELDETEPGINAAAVRSGETLKMNGTSVAAPVLARRLMNAMIDSKPKPIRREDWQQCLNELARDDPFVKWPADR